MQVVRGEIFGCRISRRQISGYWWFDDRVYAGLSATGLSTVFRFMGISRHKWLEK
jgi:hypothetical protein